MPRKMRRLAMRSVLSDKAAQGRILLIDSFETLEPRTKAMVTTLAALQLTGRKVLIMTPGRVDNLDLASGNLPNITRMHTHFLSVFEMLKADFLVMDRASLEVIEGILGQTGGRMSRPVAPPTVAPARMPSPLEAAEAAPAVEEGEPVGAVVAPVNASAPASAPGVVTVVPQNAVAPAVAAPALGTAVVASSLSAGSDAGTDEDDDYVDPDLVPEEMGEDFASGTGAWDEDEDGEDEDGDDENLGVFDDEDEEGV